MAISVLSVGLYRVKEKLQALLNVDRQFCEDDFEKVPCFAFLGKYVSCQRSIVIRIGSTLCSTISI